LPISENGDSVRVKTKVRRTLRRVDQPIQQVIRTTSSPTVKLSEKHSYEDTMKASEKRELR
jgi:hypothetical protein